VITLDTNIDINKWARKVLDRIDDFKYTTNIIIKNSFSDLAFNMVAETPVDTGTAVANWIVFKGSSPDYTNFNYGDISGVGEDYANAVAKNITERIDALEINIFKAKNTKFGIVNNTEYILTLENGLYPWANSENVINHYSIQAPEGMVKINLLKKDEIVNANIAKWKK